MEIQKRPQKRKTLKAEKKREVSADHLTLSLGDQSKNKKKRTTEISLSPRADMEEREEAFRIAAMNRPGEKEEERRRFDPWIIKKKVTRRDLGHLSRVLLKTTLEKYVLPLMEVDIAYGGLLVTVCDQDTDTMHHLFFKKWQTSKSYVLNGTWIHDFVNRRNLKEGDEIGMYWDPNYSRFNLCVLNRAPRTQPPAANGTSSFGRN